MDQVFPKCIAHFFSFAREVGYSLIFGLGPSELGQFLADRGLKLIDGIGAADYQDLYLKQIGREMKVFDGERGAYAVVMRSPEQ